MAPVQLWTAIDEQASSWRATSVFERFVAQLPRNAPQRVTGLPGKLQEMQAAGAWVGSRPLRLASSIPGLLEVMPGLEPVPLHAEWTSWLVGAQQVERAHRETVAWVRSRLPGYPALLAPQLAPGTPLTTREFTWRLQWMPDERKRGLQFEMAPVQVAQALQAGGQQHRDLDNKARLVATAFARTEEWSRLASATSALDGETRATLRGIHKRLRQRLGDEAVTAHEPRLALPRDQYRQAVLSQEIDELGGLAREYTDAFDAADQLVETAASDVFGQLAAYGRISTLARPKSLDLQPSSPEMAEFTLTKDIAVEPGMVVWLDDSLVPDALHLTEIHVQMGVATGLLTRVVGNVLAGTAAAWQPRG